MKTKFPRALALAAAADLCRLLKPVTDRLICAGSLRRKKAEVGDLELVYIPKFNVVPDGLFDTAKENLTDRALAEILDREILVQRKNSLGTFTWGERNKLAIHTATGIPVDLFATDERSWFNYLVCRTGSAGTNMHIAAEALKKGWRWHPYKEGFTDADGNLVTVHSEREVFDLVGLPYLEPWER